MDHLDSHNKQNEFAIRPYISDANDKKEEIKKLYPVVSQVIERSRKLLSELTPDESLTQDEINAAVAGLDLIQRDTAGEAENVITLALSRSGVYSDRTEIVNTIPTELDYLLPNLTVFLLFSNTFNRGDELIETAISKSENITTQKAQEMVEEVLDKGLASLVSKNGKTERISPRKMLDICTKIATRTGINTTGWDENLNFIFQSQRNGIEEVFNIRAGTPKWKYEEALDYRRNTVGRYACILGSIIFKKEEEIQAFYHQIMDFQAIDDHNDLLQDHGVQINVVEAAMRSDGIWDEFKEKLSTIVDPHERIVFKIDYLADKKYNRKIEKDLTKPIKNWRRVSL